MKWIVSLCVLFAALALCAQIAGAMQRAGVQEIYQYIVGFGIPVAASVVTLIFSWRD